MSAIKTFFKQEVKTSMLTLEHPKRTDFYLSGWQTTRSSVPLLIWRVILFLASLTLVLFSTIYYMINGIFRFWFIYLTHWGLTLLLLTTGFAVAVSARIHFVGPISAEFKLPWYVKVYWVLYNMAIPTALMITIFYWTVLFEAGVEEELNHALDIAVHGVNSVIVLLLLLSGLVPSRLLHIYQPVAFAFVYMLFGLFYHLCGGVDQNGNPYIYPVVNWSYPGKTILLVLATGILLMFLHLLTLSLAVIREFIVSRCLHKSVKVHIDEGMPLRQPAQMPTA